MKTPFKYPHKLWYILHAMTCYLEVFHWILIRIGELQPQVQRKDFMGNKTCVFLNYYVGWIFFGELEGRILYNIKSFHKLLKLFGRRLEHWEQMNITPLRVLKNFPIECGRLHTFKLFKRRPNKIKIKKQSKLFLHITTWQVDANWSNNL